MAPPSAPSPPPAFQPVFSNSTRLTVAVPQAPGVTSTLLVEDSGLPHSSSSSTTSSSPTSSSTGSQPAHRGLTCLCLPGIGDVRQQFRFLGPMLKERGYRVLVADLRGHGDSSADFESYTPLDVSSDIGAILQSAGVQTDVVLFGNSLAASSALHYAATHPEQVFAVVCLAPVARDLPQDKTFRLFSHVLFAPPWGAPLWVSYFDSLFTSSKPQDLGSYKAALGAKTREKGRLSALGQMMRGSKTPCYQKIGEVKCPVLLLHGQKDPDFASPEKEADEVARALSASKKVQVEVLSGVGHYPHVETPDSAFSSILAFLESLN